jgi:predicted AAA+ superfamily ATPase
MSIENVVAIELLRRKSMDPELEVYYWKSNQTYEVDFVLCRGRKVDTIIQVCYDITAYDTKEREVKSLIKASNDLHCDNLAIITWNKEDSE